MSSLLLLLRNLAFPLILLIAYALITSLAGEFRMLSVTTLNIVSGIIVITLGTGLAIAGAMANDSGKGGFFIHTFQWMSLSYPLIYFIGLIASISVLYSDYESKQEIATLLASMSLIWLLLIGVLFVTALAIEQLNLYHKEKKREKEIADQKKPYLIHLPHCGTVIPDEYIGDYFLSKNKLEENITQYADLYTDELYKPLLDRFGGVTNKFSRLFVDPERFFDDTRERMAQFGLGWFYENSILEKIPLRDVNNKDSVAKYYKEHHEDLNNKTQEKLDLYGKCTIIDCHSFSNERYWFHDQNLELPDICIGYDEEHADMELVQILKEEFNAYNVSINTPYSGSIVPSRFYKKNKNVKSVMIEINKKLYLDDKNKIGADFYGIHFAIEQIMHRLIFEENYRAKEY